MKVHVFGLLLLAAPMAVMAIGLTAADSDASAKIRFMQSASGTDHSRMAAYVQTDQVFSQWCGRAATVRDLKRISAQESFNQYLSQLKKGQIYGMTQIKTVLLNNNPQFCKG